MIKNTIIILFILISQTAIGQDIGIGPHVVSDILFGDKVDFSSSTLFAIGKMHNDQKILNNQTKIITCDSAIAMDVTNYKLANHLLTIGIGTSEKYEYVYLNFNRTIKCIKFKGKYSLHFLGYYIYKDEKDLFFLVKNKYIGIRFFNNEQKIHITLYDNK